MTGLGGDLLTGAQLAERYAYGDGPIVVDANELVLIARSLRALRGGFDMREGEPLKLFGRPVDLAPTPHEET